MSSLYTGPMNKSNVRFYELDLLRFVAAMAVVLYHYLFRGQQGDYIPVHFTALEDYALYGYLGVNLFFMISGFVISLSAESRNAKQFVVSRVARLYPAFWAGVTLTATIVYFFGGTLLQVDLSQYLINLTMLAQFVGVDDVDGVYWTLYVELKFYAIIFLVLFFDKFHRIEWVLSGWLALLVLNLVIPFPRILNALVFPEWAPYFISGTVFYLIKAKGFSSWRIVALTIAFMLSLYETMKGNASLNADYNAHASDLVAVVLVVLFYIIFSLIMFNKLSWFRARWAVKIGALTYPLYLIHENLGFIAFTYFDEKIDKYSLLMIIIASMIVLSWLINVLVEKRLGLFLKQWLEGILSRGIFAKGQIKHIN